MFHNKLQFINASVVKSVVLFSQWGSSNVQYHSFLEQIKMLCFHFFVARLMATTTIEPDSDLEQMRAWIERFKEDEEEEVRLSSLVLTGGGILGHVILASVVSLS